MRIFIHIPVLEREVEVYKWTGLPVIHQSRDGPVALRVVTEHKLIAITKDANEHLTMNQNAWSSCYYVGAQRICERQEAYNNQLALSCLGSLFLNYAHGVEKLCQVEQEFDPWRAVMAGPGRLLLYAKDTLHFHIRCNNGTVIGDSVQAGIREVRLDVGCNVVADQFTVPARSRKEVDFGVSHVATWDPVRLRQTSAQLQELLHRTTQLESSLAEVAEDAQRNAQETDQAAKEIVEDLDTAKKWAFLTDFTFWAAAGTITLAAAILALTACLYARWRKQRQLARRHQSARDTRTKLMHAITSKPGRNATSYLAEDHFAETSWQRREGRGPRPQVEDREINPVRPLTPLPPNPADSNSEDSDLPDLQGLDEDLPMPWGRVPNVPIGLRQMPHRLVRQAVAQQNRLREDEIQELRQHRQHSRQGQAHRAWASQGDVYQPPNLAPTPTGTGRRSRSRTRAGRGYQTDASR